MPTTYCLKPNPVRELREYLAGLADRFRARRLFGPLMEIEVVGDIAADVAAARERDSRDAHRAETCDREAESLATKAQDPESPGGVNVTPDEMARVLRLIKRSAELDHDISDRAVC